MSFIHDSSLTFPKLKQHNSSVGRVYLVNEGKHLGDVYPSITRILAAKEKPGLTAWRKRVGAKEAARVSAVATTRGANVHKLSECYLGNEELPEYGPASEEMWKHLQPWLEKNITKVYAQEQDVVSYTLEVAGRMDLLAQYRGVDAVVDVKTAAREKLEEWVEDYFLQTTFYSLAVYELTGKRFTKLVLPIVNPSGLQVFESSPGEHMEALFSRINEYYKTYEPAANTPGSTIL
jgi:genome maintenance exonuclease 1